MARQGGRIEPTGLIYGLGQNFGHIEVFSDQIHFHPSDSLSIETLITLDPELAPLFRMVANRLDEISGKKKRRS